MDLEEPALLLRVYVGEADRHEGKPLYEALVHLLREQGIWGATVLRGIYGYGKRSVLHAASPLRLSEDLPIVVEAVDSEAKIRGVLEDVSELVTDGLVTLEEIEVVTHVAGDPDDEASQA